MYCGATISSCFKGGDPSRKHDFDSMVANLERKYAKPISKRKKKNDSSTKSSNLPSEEEFLAIQSSFKPPKK